MGQVLKRNASNSWMEFLVKVEGEEGPQNVCGLCGNTGELDTTGNTRDPSGQIRVGVRAHCVCPNGRKLKVSQGKKKWGGNSVLSHDSDCQPMANELGWQE